MSPKNVAIPEGEGLSGTVRIGSARSVARRIEPGEIAVIEAPDLDRETAELLAARRPTAVLNAADSASGRIPNLGPGVLLGEGIVLVDSMGTEVLALREGQQVELRDGVVVAAGAEIAEGRVVTGEHLEHAATRAREGARFQLDGVAAATAELLVREQDLLLDGMGLPDLAALFADRPSLVIAQRASTAATLQEIRPWIRDARPVVVAVETAADTAREAGIQPDVILGPLEDVSEDALTSGAHLVLHAAGRAAGGGRTSELGIEQLRVDSALPSRAVALLLAGHHGASVVVAAGMDEGPEESLDGGREPAAASSLVRHVLGARLVAARSIPALVRPRIRTWQLLLLALAALLALGIALLTTQVGQAALGVG
nr:hypothetical protein [Actinomycetales bacterium]